MGLLKNGSMQTARVCDGVVVSVVKAGARSLRQKISRNACILKNAVIYYVLFKTSGDVAQLGERSVRIREVESSILFVSTNSSSPPRAATHFAVCRMCINIGDQRNLVAFFYVFITRLRCPPPL